MSSIMNNSPVTTARPAATQSPENTRKRLLDAVGEAIAVAGATMFTLDAIARRAGVSKGALLHHFPCKNVLVEEFGRCMREDFWNGVHAHCLDYEVAYGRMTRAYCNGILGVFQNPAQSRRWSGLMTAFVMNPSLMHMWRDGTNIHQRALEAETAENTSLMIARMAADSYWSNQLFGLQSVNSDDRKGLINHMIELTYPVPERDSAAA